MRTEPRSLSTSAWSYGRSTPAQRSWFTQGSDGVAEAAEKTTEVAEKRGRPRGPWSLWVRR